MIYKPKLETQNRKHFVKIMTRWVENYEQNADAQVIYKQIIEDINLLITRMHENPDNMFIYGSHYIILISNFRQNICARHKNYNDVNVEFIDVFRSVVAEYVMEFAY